MSDKQSKEPVQHVLPQKYVANIFAHKVTKKDLEDREELSLQGIKEGEVVLFRQVQKQDLEHYGIQDESIEGQWLRNSVFIDEKLNDHIKYKMEIHVIDNDTNPSVEVRLSAEQDNAPSIAEVVGHLDFAKSDIIAQAKGGNQQQEPEMDLVEYKLQQEDIDAMGEHGAHLEVGQTIRMPREQAEILDQVRRQPQEGKVVEMKKPRTEA